HYTQRRQSRKQFKSFSKCSMMRAFTTLAGCWSRPRLVSWQSRSSPMRIGACWSCSRSVLLATTK
ncbi:hypothetical protein H4S07_006517, partial [Coemansia furcata]